MKKKSFSKKGCLYVIVTIVFFVLLGIKIFVADFIIVEGDSMLNTYEDGDFLLIFRSTEKIERYDVITFYRGNKQLIKRVIGLPGERVQISDGRVYINDECLNDMYGNAQINNAGIAKEVIELGEEQFFVLGDNRNNSKDSRNSDVGVVLSDEIKGKVFVR